MREHRGPLAASLWAEYNGLDLENPPVTLWRLAEMVAVLPPGCAFWRAVGGRMAWSVEEQALLHIEFRLRELLHQGSKATGGKRPEAPTPPPIASEVKAEQDDMSETQRRFEARFG